MAFKENNFNELLTACIILHSVDEHEYYKDFCESEKAQLEKIKLGTKDSMLVFSEKMVTGDITDYLPNVKIERELSKEYRTYETLKKVFYGQKIAKKTFDIITDCFQELGDKIVREIEENNPERLSKIDKIVDSKIVGKSLEPLLTEYLKKIQSHKKNSLYSYGLLEMMKNEPFERAVSNNISIIEEIFTDETKSQFIYSLVDNLKIFDMPEVIEKFNLCLKDINSDDRKALQKALAIISDNLDILPYLAYKGINSRIREEIIYPTMYREAFLSKSSKSI
ncbi:hypothetical protein AB1I63_09045 [Streptococcus pneumoniae]